MFKRSFDRVSKPRKSSKRSFRDDAKAKSLERYEPRAAPSAGVSSPQGTNSPIVTIVVGPNQRMFAAHQDILCRSPFFAAACQDVFVGNSHRRIALVDEEPEVLSAVLEFLYKGDYSPRLLHDKKRNSWVLEDATDMSWSSTRVNGQLVDNDTATIYSRSAGDTVLRDTAVYCSAEKYGLEELKKLALRKQGLVAGIDVAAILRSARYAYDNTPDTDSKLRAFYLSMIVRNRKTFKRSGTMQAEMQAGGQLFFDLFVAMCNHVDDIIGVKSSRGQSPHSI